MRIILCLLILVSAPLTAGMYTHYGVTSATKEWDPNPTVGFGNRHHYGRHAWDLKGSYTPSKRSDKLNLKGMHLYYPFARQQPRFYIGGGAGLHTKLEGTRFTERWTSGEAVAGLELGPKSYIQLEYSRPFTSKHSNSASLSIGFRF